MPPLQGKPRRQAPASQAGGFTLIEILLVIALIAILAGIVIFAINPAKQLADGRNAQRRSDARTIANAVHQYFIDNNLPYSSLLRTGDTCADPANEICKTSGADCGGMYDLSALTNNQKYLAAMPADPSGSAIPNGTGYDITTNANNRVTVCAPKAENGSVISITE